MKAWMLLPFVLIAGWMMGGWLPKTELRQAREELRAARQALKAHAPRRSGFTGVTDMLGIRETATATGAKAAIDRPAPPAMDDDPETGSVTLTRGNEQDLAVVHTNRPHTDHSMKRGIEQAMEAWEARSDIARATFVSNVGLDQPQANRFDVLVAAMNIRLEHAIAQFAEQVKTGKEVGEEESIKLVRDLSTAVAATYDEMDATLPQNWRADAGKAFSATDFIDPAVALPLTDVEDALDGGFFKE